MKLQKDFNRQAKLTRFVSTGIQQTVDRFNLEIGRHAYITRSSSVNDLLKKSAVCLSVFVSKKNRLPGRATPFFIPAANYT